MSQENVEVVRRMYDAAARRDAETVLALYDPEVEFDTSRSPLPRLIGGRRLYHGHEGLRSFFRERSDALEDIRDDPHELIDAGDQVVSDSTVRGRGRTSGIEVEKRMGAIWTIRDGGSSARCGSSPQQALEPPGRRSSSTASVFVATLPGHCAICVGQKPLWEPRAR